MANRLPIVTENVLRTKGIEVHKYTSDLGGGFEEMGVGQIFGFKEVKPSSLYAVKSSKQRDSYGEKEWNIIGVDIVNRVYYVKRIS